MSLKDEVFSAMKPPVTEEDKRKELDAAAAKVYAAIKQHLLRSASNTVQGDSFVYRAYLSAEARILAEHLPLPIGTKKSRSTQIQITPLAEQLRSALIPLAAKDDIVIGEYVYVMTPSSEEADHLVGCGVPTLLLWESAAPISFSLPLRLTATEGSLFKGPAKTVTNADGTFDITPYSGGDFEVALQISFCAEQ